jgi:hypothetical protein
VVKFISDEDRIAHYRGLSLAALANAHEATSDDHRTAYLEIAGSWASIAEEAARWVGRQAEHINHPPLSHHNGNGDHPRALATNPLRP